jgi:hypothetical protein
MRFVQLDRSGRLAPRFIRIVGVLVVASAGWVALGFLATAPLGAIYGWSGHPAIPSAPTSVYIAVYLIALPALCLFAGWKLTGWIDGRIRRRGRRSTGA